MKKLLYIILISLSVSCENTQKAENHVQNQAGVQSLHTNARFWEAITPKTNTPDTKGMMLIRGGKIRIGSQKGWENEMPVFETKIQDFYLDQHPVTVAEFRKFIQTTHYQTDADRFGDAGVFDFENRVWRLVKGANWEYPLGTDHAKAEDEHPVTQVSWRDAQAYCKWTAKRLPTEAEWEYAARNGKNTDQIYSWGSEREKDGKYLSNVWQGSFPEYNSAADGYLLTSPVGKFGKNELGLSDMGGNVWEWCANTYRLYPGNQQPYEVVDSIKAQRGGSFMCDYKVCHAYRVSGRGSCSWETSLFHTGFRCAADVKKN